MVDQQFSWSKDYEVSIEASTLRVEGSRGAACLCGRVDVLSPRDVMFLDVTGPTTRSEAERPDAGNTVGHEHERQVTWGKM